MCHPSMAKAKTRTETQQPQTGPYKRARKTTQLDAETRDPASQDPRDHKEQPLRHDMSPMHSDANTDNAGLQRVVKRRKGETGGET